MKRWLRRGMRSAAWPARAFIDPRLGRLEDHLRHRIDRLEQAVLPEVQTAAEFYTLHSRTLDELNQRVERLTAELAAASYVNAPLSAVGDDFARLLDYAESHVGFDAQASLWFNPPLSLAHHKGSVTVDAVNERILEVPYAMRRLGAMPAGASILDFGAVESTLSLSLASLGYHVTALDLRDYPLDHPNLAAVAQPVEEWEGPAQPFDAIASVSTLEHVGLTGYGGTPFDLGHDRVVLQRMGGWLRDGGSLVLTAPFGKATTSAFQRTYDDERLTRLLEGWRVEDRIYGVCTDRLHWITTSEPPSADIWGDEAARGVVMVSALKQ